MDIYDTVQDCIIFKSGMLLSINEIESVCKTINTDLSKTMQKSKDLYYRFRPEELEHVINEIRVAIGELDDSDPLPMLKTMMKHPEFQDDFARITNVFPRALTWHQQNYGIATPLGENFANYLAREGHASEIAVTMFLLSMTQHLNRSMTYTRQIKTWNGVAKLSSLFESEELPNLPETYFDQRYIDFIAKNTNSLYSMHWRQFEGLTAEFFSRTGFDVKIGPGRKDGGVDVFAVDKKSNQVLLIQCKRYSANKTVELNTIKALYFDIVDQHADHALLATTSRLCPEGKRIIAKNYPITAAEHNNIIEWVKTMETSNKW